MADDQRSVCCASCGEPIPEVPGLPSEERIRCPNCGSTSREYRMVFSETLAMHGFIDGKKKSRRFPSKRKVRIHLQAGDQINQRTGRWVFKERRIDKDVSPAWYFERITDPETSKVIHERSEPLEKHTGHGSAREDGG